MSLPPIYQILSGATAVTDIVQNRIYRHGIAPEKVQRPYVVWWLVTGTPENQLSGLPSTDRMTLQIDCYHPDDKGMDHLVIAVRDAMEPHAHMTGMPLDMRDYDTRLFRRALEFDYFLDRHSA